MAKQVLKRYRREEVVTSQKTILIMLLARMQLRTLQVLLRLQQQPKALLPFVNVGTAWLRSTGETESHRMQSARQMIQQHWKRPQCSGEAVVPSGDGRSQRSSCFHAGTSVGCANRRANSVQPHFFDFGSVAAVDRKLFRSATRGTDSVSRARRRGRKVERKNRGSNGCV
jgi:hypothetical protein